VKNEEVLRRIKETRNIQHKIKRWKAKTFGHIMHRKCLPKHIIEGKVDVRKK
jgi:hypothetical protein